jgi:hypothetical protein
MTALQHSYKLQIRWNKAKFGPAPFDSDPTLSWLCSTPYHAGTSMNRARPVRCTARPPSASREQPRRGHVY